MSTNASIQACDNIIATDKREPIHPKELTFIDDMKQVNTDKTHGSRSEEIKEKYASDNNDTLKKSKKLFDSDDDKPKKTKKKVSNSDDDEPKKTKKKVSDSDDDEPKKIKDRIPGKESDGCKDHDTYGCKYDDLFGTSSRKYVFSSTYFDKSKGEWMTEITYPNGYIPY